MSGERWCKLTYCSIEMRILGQCSDSESSQVSQPCLRIKSRCLVDELVERMRGNQLSFIEFFNVYNRHCKKLCF